MLFRTALLTLITVTSLTYSPAAASAQQGLDRAAVASAQATTVDAGKKNRADKGIPRGVAKRFDGQTLPPGIRRTREVPAPVIDPDPETDTNTDSDTDSNTDCVSTIVFVNGIPMVQGCEG